MSTLTASTTSTGEFHPSNTGHSAKGGSLTQVGNSLYYLVPDSKEYLKMVTCNLADLITNNNLSGIDDSSNWSNFMLDDQFSHSNDAHYKTHFAPSMTLQNGSLYCLWTDTHDEGQVYIASMDSFGNWCSQPMKAHATNSSGTSGHLISLSDLSVHACDDGLILYLYDTKHSKLACVKFDLTEMDPSNGRWDGTLLPEMDPSDWGLDLDKTYYRISTEWFSQGSNGSYMLASFYSSDDHKGEFICFPINDDLTPNISGSSDRFPVHSFSARRGITLKRDSSGMILATYCHDDDDKDLRWKAFSTNQEVDSNQVLDWQSSVQVNGINKDSEKRPQSFFVVATPSEGSLALSNPEGDSQDFPASVSNVYSFVYYCDGDHTNHGYKIQVQVANYGSTYLVPNYSSMEPSDETKDTILLSHLMDSFPFPNENIGSVEPGNPLITYQYGTSNGTSTKMEVNWAFQFGLKTEVSTSKGVGPAAEASFETGPEGSLEIGSGTTTTQAYSMDTAAQSNGVDVVISPRGRADGHTLFSISQTAALFYDSNNNLQNGVLAPLYNLLTPVPGHGSYATSTYYDVYSSTPGDINSYTETNINSRMAALYDEAVDNGYGSYFPSDYAEDYIQQVIEPRAQKMPNGQLFLEYQVNANGGSVTTFESIDEIQATAGWTVDSSTYLGVGFGEEISLFGFGEEISGSAMAGFSYQLEVVGSVDTNSSWGVGAEYSYEDYVSGSKYYTVRMYICKPDNLWAREVQFMAQNVVNPDQIDFDSSEPMKIMFVVYGIGDND